MWLALDPGAMYEYEPNAYGSTVHLRAPTSAVRLCTRPRGRPLCSWYDVTLPLMMSTEQQAQAPYEYEPATTVPSRSIHTTPLVLSRCNHSRHRRCRCGLPDPGSTRAVLPRCALRGAARPPSPGCAARSAWRSQLGAKGACVRSCVCARSGSPRHEGVRGRGHIHVKDRTKNFHHPLHDRRLILCQQRGAAAGVGQRRFCRRLRRRHRLGLATVMMAAAAGRGGGWGAAFFSSSTATSCVLSASSTALPGLTLRSRVS
jgi:hypothetical protein